MSDALGRAAVRFGVRYLRRRYRRELRIGLGVAVVLAALGAFFASRNVREG
jgi:hypothetical protein